ncbi:MAG: RNA methyltransferase [Vicinamibacterales bacterium]
MPTLLAIESLDDPRVADYRFLADPQYLLAHGLFVAEGRLVLRQLLKSFRFETRSILVTPAAVENLGAALNQTQAPIYVAPQALMNEVAGFNIHRGCLALGVRPAAGGLENDVLDRATRIVVLEGVSNPDNVGGLFRSAAAFGVDLVVLGPDCGDPLYRKAIRTSMAATLEVPYASAGAWPEAITQLRQQGCEVLALTPAASAPPLAGFRPASNRLALLVGSEGDGLTAAALELASAQARIPMSGAVDSLNVTTAGSIAMYFLFS